MKSKSTFSWNNLRNKLKYLRYYIELNMLFSHKNIIVAVQDILQNLVR